ncbi:MAG: mechanosensitive ion channel [Deltaproteobacteria bacterium]|nr:MAG: mechanosensitive ion channel [Deltaproteobacteria bacterium]
MGDILWHVFIVGLLIAGGSVAGSWAADLTRVSLTRTELDPVVRRLLVSWVRPIFLIFGVLAALRYLSVDMTSAVAVLGAATLAIGMALQGSLSNVAAGALILTTRPYRGGDSVEIAGHAGTVTEMTLFHTVLHTADGREVVLPNNTVIGGAIVNVTTRGQRRVDLIVVLEPGTDLAQVEFILLGALKSDERVLAEPAPSFALVDVLPYGVQVRASGWTVSSNFGGARSATFRTALAELAAAGIPLATQRVR